MKLNKSPLFRRVIIPWYDSDLFCLVISIFAAYVFYFSTVGIGVALEHQQYQRYRWVPLTLMFLSGVLLVANLFRIVSRIVKRFTEEE